MSDPCDFDLGGIWLPHPKGGKDFFPVRCNEQAGHRTPHRFLDPHSGNAVEHVMIGNRTIDSKGCVHDD